MFTPAQAHPAKTSNAMLAPGHPCHSVTTTVPARPYLATPPFPTGRSPLTCAARRIPKGVSEVHFPSSPSSSIAPLCYPHRGCRWGRSIKPPLLSSSCAVITLELCPILNPLCHEEMLQSDDLSSSDASATPATSARVQCTSPTPLVLPSTSCQAKC
jgi:hypothetical protein